MKNYLFYPLLLISGFFYLMNGYFVERSQFGIELGCFLACFTIYFILVANLKLSIGKLFLAGLFFRLLFLGGEPRLSDDYYRFVWDARINAVKDEVYESKPSSHFAENSAEAHLIMSMNSADYYSVYPPFQQLFFLPAGYTDDLRFSVFILHLIILLGELLLFYFLIQAMQLGIIGLSVVGWIWLNPLWIIEVNGNLHFEGWACAFFLMGICSIYRKKIMDTILYFSMSASLKLIPALLIPFVKKLVKTKRAIEITLASALLVALGIVYIYLSGDLSNFMESLDLYFHKFEFNASVYFLLGYFGRFFTDMHPIVYSGYILIPIFLLFYVWVYFRKQEKSMDSFISSSALILTAYYLCATTVHPWYILMILFFSVLWGKYYGIVWSFLAFFSYAAYSGNEDLYHVLMIVEYGLLALWIVAEYLEKITVLPKISKD